MRLALALALLAAPALAQTADPARALRGAFQSVGCVMDADNQGEVLAGSGLTADDATDAVGTLMAAGELVVEGETLRLVSGDCAGVGGAAPDPAAQAERRGRVAAALVGRGCRVSERESTAFAGELGLPDTEVVATLFELVGRGEARIDRSGAAETIILTAAPCDGGATGSLPLRLVEVIRANGCAISEAEADVLLPPLGDEGQVRDAIRLMIAARAAMPGGPGGDTVLLSEPLCSAADAAATGRLLAGLEAITALPEPQRPAFRPAPLAATVAVARALRATGCADARDAVERLVFATHLADPPGVLSGWLAAGFLTGTGDRIALGADWCTMPEDALPLALTSVLPAGRPAK